MTLTAWLLVFGGLTVTAIVIDGLRRMFASHAALKIDIDESLCGLHQEEFTSELPNGGARAVGPGVIVLASSDGSDSDIEPYAELEPMALELGDITLDEVSVEPFLEIEVEEASVEPSLEIKVEATASLVEADSAVLAVEDRHEELQEQFQQQLHFYLYYGPNILKFHPKKKFFANNKSSITAYK